ncbi:iron-sulfur cluster-binding protein [Seongchinamella sediminis]|uniref:Iron-sulfur cluster-binding protein n=1 Tax=Seongchinamella sediminis TaxID=2283635 RepID=A0A3L7DYI7_9GAMM|nr:LutB/LldF family L-lactate oxidation iron-sulfur protein [Seongchinamella sediminis]RLQ22667.1 iron-sulfur cluster-binding protein [Seongchinamella sediminis]
MELQSQHFHSKTLDALADKAGSAQRDAMALFTPIVRNAAVQQFGDFEALRRHVKRLRQHTLDNLDYYLARFELEACNNGSQVHYADSATELNSIVLDICQQHDARKVAKGKSMVTEETGLNDYLMRGGLEVTETDLGEYIIQQAGETPSHIVGPALHKSKAQIRQLFQEKHDLGERELETTSDLVGEARAVLRDKFLQADVGIIGANALIAETGYSMLVTNEGNGDLCANLPRVLIICTTLDRVLPRGEDATAVQRLLVRSATGQPQTCYTSFYSGPRRETELDGPLETHIVLLDNQRSDILASDYREMLQCIRCGACLNHCPIFAASGGHSYGWVYPGPMGSVLTPLLNSLEDAEALPNACTSCGRCAEVCPADIPLPDLLRDLRHQQSEEKIGSPRWRAGLRLHAWLAARPGLYQFLTARVMSILSRLGRRQGRFRKLPFASGWTGQRDFPTPQGGSFMQQYKGRRGGHE